MKITNAKYQKDPFTNKDSCITATIDGIVWGVPMDLENMHYKEIKKQIDAGTLTVEAAD
tara:strand:+ start:1235 stop:1411 length:177 start_codon:yes stop_codon:yes gene_type:complete